MKKILLSLVTLISLTAFSQSLTINPSTYYYVETGEQAVAHFDVTNNSDTELEVIVTRSYDESYDIMSTFCWGTICYPPTVNVSVVSIFIAAGESFGGFTGYINDMPEEATYMINYCFSVVEDPTDAVCADIVFTSMSVLGCLDPLAYNYNPEATVDDSGSCIYQDCSISIQEENIPLYLPDGWSMFGYTCLEPLDLSLGFESVVDRVAIVKDFVGTAYLPEWNFNGIGDLIYSRGYQIKTTEEILDFSFCPTITVSQEVSSPQLQIGDQHAGGIVFQINENGSGLVAAMEDLPNYYEWGQAVSQAPSYSSEGYTGWHLPSLVELELMYNTIGQGADNSGNFEYDWYWSSSEYDFNYAWYVHFYIGDPDDTSKYSTYRVRVIRAF